MQKLMERVRWIYQQLKGDFMGRFADQGQLNEDNKISEAIHVIKNDDGYVTVFNLHDLPGVEDFDLTNGHKDLWIKTEDDQTTRKLLKELNSLVSHIEKKLLIKQVKEELKQEKMSETTEP